jgi:hypothetical protein
MESAAFNSSPIIDLTGTARASAARSGTFWGGPGREGRPVRFE